MLTLAYLGFFDVETRTAKLTSIGARRSSSMPGSTVKSFGLIRNRCVRRKEKSFAGVKHIDAVLIFKMWVLQHLYNMADEEIEYPIAIGSFSCVFWKRPGIPIYLPFHSMKNLNLAGFIAIC